MHYPVPLHRQPCLQYLALDSDDYPRADRWANEGLSLPLFYGMTFAQVDWTAEKYMNSFSAVEAKGRIAVPAASQPVDALCRAAPTPACLQYLTLDCYCSVQRRYGPLHHLDLAKSSAQPRILDFAEKMA
jgi:hypothetical protein